MTDAPRAIDGDYADFKIIRTRNTVQIVVEVPLERGDDVVKLFGLPNPGKPQRVALALLVQPQPETPASPVQLDSRRKWPDMKLAQQAGIRCSEPAFHKYLQENGHPCADADAAAVNVRLICGIHSRAELDTNPSAGRKWRELDAAFDAWMHAPEVA